MALFYSLFGQFKRTLVQPFVDIIDWRRTHYYCSPFWEVALWICIVTSLPLVIVTNGRVDQTNEQFRLIGVVILIASVVPFWISEVIFLRKLDQMYQTDGPHRRVLLDVIGERDPDRHLRVVYEQLRRFCAR